MNIWAINQLNRKGVIMEILDLNGVETIIIDSNKFKTITFLVSFFGDFSKENATKRSLLTRILSNSTKNFPSRKLFTNQLFDLYDINVSVSSTSIHEVSITNFIFEAIHPKYIHDINYTDELFKFIHEVIFNPNINGDGFNESVFNEEKKILSESIRNIYNNKPYYALKRIFQEMCHNEISSVSNLGTLEDLDLITKENLYEFYQDMINNEFVKVHVIGEVKKINIKSYLLELGFKKNFKYLKFINTDSKVVNDIKEIIDTQKINQAQLMIGYRTNINYLDELYVPSLVLRMMLGGMASSDLFKIVREENSLAYSVNALLYSADKILIINAGIDQKNYNLTKNLIIGQINQYKLGKIKKTLLATAKKNLINSIHESFDDTVATLMFYAKNTMLNNLSFEELISRIKSVSIDDIVKVSKSLQLDTIYMLAGEDNA